MQDPDCEELAGTASQLDSVMLTVAPESVTNAQIAKLASAGAIVSLGHTDCSYETAHAAASAGAVCVTHVFNAMSQLTNREPGLVGAVLDIGALSGGLIADGYHSDRASLGVALRGKRGPGKMFLVSDAMASIGSTINEFELNGRTIFRKHGRLTLADGTLAGADIDLMAAVRFLVEQVDVDVDEAIRMASTYPAQLLGRGAEIGTLLPGARADFLLLDDLNLKGVWRGGIGIR